MRAERVIESELRAAVREQGIASLDEVDVLVLETDGSFTVIRGSLQDSDSALANVTNYPPDRG
jgi:uncharacterized membrane protein YcaP (DUF421 family)